jgi:hypothetical protein
MPALSMDELTLGLAVVAGVALLAILFVLILAFRLRKVRREYKVLLGGSEQRDIVNTVGNALRHIETMDKRVQAVGEEQQKQAAKARFALQRFHIVRYDAFDDMGGRLSFSAALLDEHGDGVVITSINGRTETRTYAKPVQNLNSEHNLSAEERAAIAGAVSGEARSEVAASASR